MHVRRSETSWTPARPMLLAVCLQVKLHLLLPFAVPPPLCYSAPFRQGAHPPCLHLENLDQVGSDALSELTQLISTCLLSLEFGAVRDLGDLKPGTQGPKGLSSLSALPLAECVL